VNPPAPTKTEQPPRVAVSFEREADGVARDLRAALAALIERLRPPVTRAADLRRALNLGQKVSWGLFTAATNPDVRALPALMPGRRGMERFLEAAASNGVGSDAIGRVRTAFARFEETVARLAGDRDAFQSMMTELGGADRGDADEGPAPGADPIRHKRAAFRSNTVLWGRQVRVACGTYILHPSERPGLLDMVFLRGMIGLRRTRRGVPLHMLVRVLRESHPGDPEQPSPMEPLDPTQADPDSVRLLPEFCSRPTPQFRIHTQRPGYRCHELVGDALGVPGEVTYFTGETCRGACPVPGSVPGAIVAMTKTMDVPTGVFVGDMLIHRSVWGLRPPDVRVLAYNLDLEEMDPDQLPVTERVEYLGDGVEAARTPLIPRYAEMLSYAMDRMGWNGTEFRVFRCRADYPVLHSRVQMTLR
jgi:hypothetical protein